jgi:hypothetical protein
VEQPKVPVLKRLFNFSWCKSRPAEHEPRDETVRRLDTVVIFSLLQPIPVKQGKTVAIPKANPNALVLKLSSIAEDLCPVTGDAVQCAGMPRVAIITSCQLVA